VDRAADHGKSATVPTWEGDTRLRSEDDDAGWLPRGQARCLARRFLALRRPAALALTPVEAAPSVFAAARPSAAKRRRTSRSPSATPSSSASRRRPPHTGTEARRRPTLAGALPQGKPQARQRNGQVRWVARQHVNRRHRDGTAGSQVSRMSGCASAASALMVLS